MIIVSGTQEYFLLSFFFYIFNIKTRTRVIHTTEEGKAKVYSRRLYEFIFCNESREREAHKVSCLRRLIRWPAYIDFSSQLFFFAVLFFQTSTVYYNVTVTFYVARNARSLRTTLRVGTKLANLICRESVSSRFESYISPIRMWKQICFYDIVISMTDLQCYMENASWYCWAVKISQFPFVGTLATTLR